MTLAARELVNAAKRALGATTQKDLVYELRFHYGFITDQSQVSKWEHGQDPNYEATMVLLVAAGWLNIEGAVSQPGGDRPADLPTIQRTQDLILEAVEVLATKVESIDQKLGAPQPSRQARGRR